MSTPRETSPALSALPRVHHGFFNRMGGISSGPYGSNNVSYSVGDDRAAPAVNRAGVARTLSFQPRQLCVLKQVHSAEVVTLEAVPDPEAVIEADAMVTAEPGLLLGILTADCTPILLADPVAGVIGAAHAGWRGAAAGICKATVLAMVKLGAQPARIVAAIGPTISGENYEVGPQFAADLLKLYPQSRARISVPEGGVEHFDLPGFIEDRLSSMGVGVMERVGGCTYAHSQRYFSHRFATHAGRVTGRQIAAIGMR
jgi:YfiH family protein